MLSAKQYEKNKHKTEHNLATILFMALMAFISAYSIYTTFHALNTNQTIFFIYKENFQEIISFWEFKTHHLSIVEQIFYISLCIMSLYFTLSVIYYCYYYNTIRIQRPIKYIFKSFFIWVASLIVLELLLTNSEIINAIIYGFALILIHQMINEEFIELMGTELRVFVLVRQSPQFL
jgi:hypothetical protein